MARMMNTTIAAGVTMLALADPAGAAVYDLDFASLPTAQGWTYVGGGNPAAYFTATGDALVQNTLSTTAVATFQRAIALGDDQSFRLIVEARITGNVQNGPLDKPFGFSFGATSPNHYNYFGIGPDKVSYATGEFDVAYADLPAGFDPLASNRFELIGSGGLTSFRINGIEVMDARSIVGIGYPSVLYLGDGTLNYGAASSITRYTFLTDQDAAAAVPEPAAWATMLLGFGLVGTAMRQRRRVFA